MKITHLLKSAYRTVVPIGIRKRVWEARNKEVPINSLANIVTNGKLDVISIISHTPSPYFVVLDKKNDPVSCMLREGIPFNDTLLTESFKLVKDGVFLDLGANIGAFSLYMAANGWKGYSFEASLANTNLLRKSAFINDFDIKIIDKIISDHTGNLLFYDNSIYGFVINDACVFDSLDNRDEHRVIELPCIALDDMPELADLQKVDLVKMDIEGSEAAALRGMSRLLSRLGYPPIYMEVNAWTLFLMGETPYSLMKTASDIGYTAYTFEDVNTVCEFVLESFPTLVLRDIILIKDLPDHFRVVINEARQDNDADIDWILRKLIDRKNWEHHDVYIIYTLRDYPQYYNNPIIKQALSEIADSESNDILTEMAIGWFKAI